MTQHSIILFNHNFIKMTFL